MGGVPTEADKAAAEKLKADGPTHTPIPPPPPLHTRTHTPPEPSLCEPLLLLVLRLLLRLLPPPPLRGATPER